MASLKRTERVSCCAGGGGAVRLAAASLRSWPTRPAGAPSTRRPGPRAPRLALGGGGVDDGAHLVEADRTARQALGQMGQVEEPGADVRPRPGRGRGDGTALGQPGLEARSRPLTASASRRSSSAASKTMRPAREASARDVSAASSINSDVESLAIEEIVGGARWAHRGRRHRAENGRVRRSSYIRTTVTTTEAPEVGKGIVGAVTSRRRADRRAQRRDLPGAGLDAAGGDHARRRGAAGGGGGPGEGARDPVRVLRRIERGGRARRCRRPARMGAGGGGRLEVQRRRCR